jgi:monoamine oxidase
MSCGCCAMHDVVVVGGGLSGLTAGHRLAAGGADVVVLEAAGRVGGRVWTRTDRGVRWEAGGEAVDAANERLRGLAGELGVPLVESAVGWGDHGPSPSRAWVAGRSGFPLPDGYRALLDEIDRLGRDPDPAADEISVMEWMTDQGAPPFDRAVAQTMIAVAASTMPLRRMSLLALAVKDAARGGPRSDSAYRFGQGAGGLAEALAGRLGQRVRLAAPVVEVRQRQGRVAVRTAAGDELHAGRAVTAVPLHARARIYGLPRPPAGAAYGVAVKSLIELDRPLPDGGPTSVVTDSVVGYAYRRDERTLGSFVGSAPAAQLAALSDEQALAAVGAVLQGLLGVRPTRVTRVVYPRSYLILAPGQLTTWGDALREPVGLVHVAGAEASVLPSFMEGAVRAGERAAEEISG